MRQIDVWVDANALTLLATAVTSVFAWEWQERHRRAARALTGTKRAIAQFNVQLARGFLLLNAAIFLLGLALIQTARDIDRAASAAHPARVPGYVVNGSVAFTSIWVAVCCGAWWFRRRMEAIIELDEATPLRAVGRDERAG